MAEKCQKNNYKDNDAYLQQIKIMVDSTNKALVEVEENLKFIQKDDELLKQHETTGSSTSYIPLDHSRQREFMETITSLLDVVRNWDDCAANCESQSFPRLKAALQQVETAIMRNYQDFNGLEAQISELQSYYESVKHICPEYDNTSCL